MTIYINPLNAELNPICRLLALLGAHHILHVTRIRVKSRNHALNEAPAVSFQVFTSSLFINQSTLRATDLS